VPYGSRLNKGIRNDSLFYRFMNGQDVSKERAARPTPFGREFTLFFLSRYLWKTCDKQL